MNALDLIHALGRPALAACLLLSCPILLRAETAPPASSSHALALLAPQGHWVGRMELRANGYDSRYDASGQREPLGAVFDGITLDAQVFPALAALGPGASLGDTAFTSEVDLQRVEFTLGYGLTDDLTVGGILNAGRSRNRIDLRVSGGNVGWNPTFDPSLPVGPGNFPFAPAGGGVAPLDAGGISQLLINPVFGYGYAPLRSSRTSGFGDLTLGLMWRFYRRDADSLVLGLGVRRDLSGGDNPDDLFDVPLGDGSTDLLGQLEYFRDLGHGFDLRLLAKRTLQMADHVVSRVPAPGTLLAPASSKERLARNLGDYWEYDAELGHSWGDWRVSGTWHRWQKGADSYRSPSGRDTTMLTAGTAIQANQWRVSVSWSGIEAWRRRVLPLPLIVKLELQDTYQGRNMTDVRDVYLQLTSAF